MCLDAQRPRASVRGRCDFRNGNSAAALCELADHVEALPDDDPGIVAAGVCDQAGALADMGIDVEDGFDAARIGFGNKAVDVDGEFTWYVRENVEAAVRAAEYTGTKTEFRRLAAIQLELLRSLTLRS